MSIAESGKKYVGIRVDPDLIRAIERARRPGETLTDAITGLLWDGVRAQNRELPLVLPVAEKKRRRA